MENQICKPDKDGALDQVCFAPFFLLLNQKTILIVHLDKICKKELYRFFKNIY